MSGQTPEPTNSNSNPASSPIDPRSLADAIVSGFKEAHKPQEVLPWEDKQKYWLAPEGMTPDQHAERLHTNVERFVDHKITQAVKDRDKKIEELTNKIREHEGAFEYFEHTKAPDDFYSKNRDAIHKIMKEEGVNYKTASRIFKSENKPAPAAAAPVPPPSATSPNTPSVSVSETNKKRGKMPSMREVVREAQREGKLKFD